MFRRAENSSSLSARSHFSSARKFKEKNIVSAVLGTATIAVLCASLVEPVWFTLTGGTCCYQYISINSFFGHFYIDYKPLINPDCESQSEQSTSYEHCINQTALTLIQIIIMLCFLAIISSLFSFVLDVIAPRKRALWKIMKRYSWGYIFTVLLCATIVGFCYWTSQEIFFLQYNNRLYEGSQVKVGFDMGVYLVAIGGGIAVLATASNLMRQYPTEEEEQVSRLMEQESDDENESSWMNIVDVESEPPAYVQ